MTARRLAGGLAIAAAALALGGCVSANDVAHMIVAAPNKQQKSTFPNLLDKMAGEFYTEQFKVRVGPPRAALAVAVIAPRNYGFSASAQWKQKRKALVLKWRIHGNMSETRADKSKNKSAGTLTGKKAWRAMHRMFAAAIPKLPVCRATGTVILLPGWGEMKSTLLGYALDFASRGYRVVLVDLRGQGESSGNYITYGLIEHRDISQLISALYQRRLIAGKLALVGFSEGATIALDTAAADPRVDGVAAIAPFVNLKRAIRATATSFMPNMSKMVSKQKLTHALAIADHMVGRNLADANPTSRVAAIRAPVLYVAGAKDKISPVVEVKKLAKHTRNAKFVEIPRYPHIAIYFGVAAVAPPVLATLEKALGPVRDPACLAKPPPKNARYDFPFTLTITKR
jgi:pimeloyl-ACP methyl ester carboxylesterase